MCEFTCDNCSLEEEEINSFDEDKYTEICHLLKHHCLDPDDADDVSEAQGLLRQHILARERARGDGGVHGTGRHLKHDVIGSLVRDHHKRREILLRAAHKVQDFITQLPPLRKKEIKRYFPELEQNLELTVTELRNEKCMFIIAGESGSGKSCLINLLMGQHDRVFLPVSNLPSTSCMCDISYGDPGQLTAYPPESEDSSPVVTPLTAENAAAVLSDFTHQKQDRERIRYNRVEVQWPCEWLKGINLVDSPGVGENEEMTRLVKLMMPEAVGLIYVINTQKAGGIQPGDLEDLLFHHISAQEGRCLPGDGFDPTTALFIFNKWDCIAQKEKDKVRQFVCNKLKQVWKGLDVTKQIFFLSAQQATEALRGGFVTEEYRRVLTGIERLMEMSLRCKMRRHYAYLTAVLERCKFILLMYLNSYPNLREEYTEAKARMQELSSKSHIVKKQLKETFKSEVDGVMVKMKEHLGSIETRERLCTWHATQCPNKDLKRAVKVMARLRVYEDIRRWEEENEIYAKAQQKMMEVFQNQFVALTSDLSSIEGQLFKAGDNANIKTWLRNIGVSAHDSELLKMAKKVAMGITLGVLTGFVGLTGLGIYEATKSIGRYIQRKREEGKHMSDYQAGTIDLPELMERETSTVIDSIVQGSSLQSAIEETLGGLVVTLNSMLKKIPECIEADRALLSDMQRQLEEGLDDNTRRQCDNLLEKVVHLQQLLDYCCLIYIEKPEIPETDIEISWGEKLGGGTFGDVYHGVLIREGERVEVAVKTLKAGLSYVNATEVRTEAQYLRATVVFRVPKNGILIAIYKTLSDCQTIDSPNMVEYYGMCMSTHSHPDDPDTRIHVPCMVIEKCEISLDHVIYNSWKYKGPGVVNRGDPEIVRERAIRRMSRYAAEIANGLSAMHHYNLAHRDIKPGNILVKLTEGPEGLTETLKLCDFGMSKSVDYITHSDVGTLLYMAPEVINKKHYGKEADLFSYGIILIELYYGKLAHRLGFIRCSLQPTTFHGDPFSLNRPPCDWVELVTRCYSHTAEERPSAEECVDFFTDYDVTKFNATFDRME